MLADAVELSRERNDVPCVRRKEERFVEEPMNATCKNARLLQNSNHQTDYRQM